MFFAFQAEKGPRKAIASLLVSGFVLICAAGPEAMASLNNDILAASKAGDRAGLEVALGRGASVNAGDDAKHTPLVVRHSSTD